MDKLNEVFSNSFRFDDASSTPQPLCQQFRKAIFIGIGGTGQNVIRRLKAKMDRYGLLRLPTFGFLAFDTEGVIPVGDPARELPIERGEFVSLQEANARFFVDEAVKARQGKPSAQKELGEWLPEEFSTASVMMGAGGKRSVGRFAFFVNAERAGEAMNRVVLRVEQVGNDKALQDIGLRLDPTAPTSVYIICSLCGGTGSGIFLDLAYLFRELLKTNSHGRTQINGMLLVNFPYANEWHRANEYAALMELNYFSMSHTVFKAKYKSTSLPQIENSQPPFDFAYLIGTQNQSGRFLNTIEAVSDAVAETLFVLTCTEAGQEFAAGMDNVGKNLVSMSYDIGGASYEGERRPTCFSGFGISTAEIPTEWIVNRWGADLCIRLLEGMTSRESEYSNDAVARSVEVLSQFGGTESVDSFAPYNESRNEMMNYISKNVRGQVVQPKEPATVVLGKLRQLRSLLARSLDEHIDKKGLEACAKSIRDLEGSIQSAAASIYANPEKGGYAAADVFLEFVIGALTKLRQQVIQLHEQQSTRQRSVDELLDGVEEELSRPRRLLVLGPPGDPVAIENRYRKLLENKVKTRWELATLQHLAMGLEALCARLGKMREDVRQALGVMEAVKARFEKEKAEAGPVPQDLAVYSEAAIDEEWVEKVYNEAFANWDDEKALFLKSISLARFVQLSEAEMYHAMRCYAAARLHQTILNISVADILRRRFGSDHNRLNSYIGDLYGRADIFWTVNEASLNTPVRRIDLLVGKDDDTGLLKEAWQQQIVEGSDRRFKNETAIPSRIWILRTGHGISVDTLTDVDRCYEDFKATIDREGTTYLFTHRVYPTMMAHVTVRPGHSILPLEAPTLWVKALAYGLITRDSHTGAYNLVLPSCGQRPRVIGEGRAKSFAKFRRDSSMLEEVKPEIDSIEARSDVGERREKFRKLLEEVRELEHHPDIDTLTLEQLRLEKAELEALIREYTSLSI